MFKYCELNDEHEMYLAIKFFSIRYVSYSSLEVPDGHVSQL